MPVQSIPYILLLGSIFGITLIGSRFSVGQFYPLAYVGIRLALASGAYMLFYLSGRRKIPRDRQLWKHAIILGVFGSAIPMSLLMSSLEHLSSGVVSVLVTANPVMAVLMAHFFLGDEHLNLRKSLGVLLALAGVLLITLLGESGLPDVSKANPFGYFLVFLSLSFGSSMMVYSRKYMKGFSSFDVTSIRMLTAASVLVPVMFLTDALEFSRVNATGVLVILYASFVGTFLGVLMEFHIIKRFGATAGSMPAYVIPVVATIGGVVLLGETITWVVVTGFLLIMSGLALINRSYYSLPSRLAASHVSHIQQNHSNER